MLLTIFVWGALLPLYSTDLAYIDPISLNTGFFMSFLLQNAGFEATMLDNDKLMVVLAVVLIIWAGFCIFMFLTDRKVDRLESSVQQLIDQNTPNS